MTSPEKSKPTIFQVLQAIDDGSSFFDDLSDEDLKSYQPYVLTRWMAGSNNANIVLFLNEMQNVYNNSLHRHKRLLFRLLQTTRGSSIRPKWIAPPKKTKAESLSASVVQESVGCSKREAQQLLVNLSPETILAEAERLGWQKDDIKKLKQELT